ncbi:ALP1-like protein [Tanacetum coccineum]
MIIKLKWLWKKQEGLRSRTVIRNKARLVAKGYAQEEGIDFEESFCLQLLAWKQFGFLFATQTQHVQGRLIMQGCLDTRKSILEGYRVPGDKNLGRVRGVICKLCSSNVDGTQLQDYGFNYKQKPFVLPISVSHSEYQLADMCTKSPSEDRFKYLVRRMVRINPMINPDRRITKDNPQVEIESCESKSGSYTVVPYVVNGVEYRNGYYLVDGIYQEWASFVKSFTVTTGLKHTYFKQRQESARKDVERAFGVLQERRGLIQQPARAYEVNTLRRIMYADIIMHNMILEDQNMSVVDMKHVYSNHARSMQTVLAHASSEILANRLSKVIDKIVAKEQSAFIGWSSNLDGPFGFGNKWCSWIKACLNSSRASILINGSPTSEFSIKCGLRQGDPLSPFLFILVMEGLHNAFEEAVGNGLISVLILRILLIKLHLFYADDVNLKNGLESKDMINIHSCSPYEVLSMASNAGCMAGDIPFNYLGLPIGSKMKSIASVRVIHWQTLKLFNHAPSSKRRWRFAFSSPNALWVQVHQSLSCQEWRFALQMVVASRAFGEHCWKPPIFSIEGRETPLFTSIIDSTS